MLSLHPHSLFISFLFTSSILVQFVTHKMLQAYGMVYEKNPDAPNQGLGVSTLFPHDHLKSLGLL